jgi:hypothetical protein
LATVYQAFGSGIGFGVGLPPPPSSGGAPRVHVQPAGTLIVAGGGYASGFGLVQIAVVSGSGTSEGVDE